MGFTLNTALKDSSCTATTWYLQDSGGSQLATGSFSGDTATINYHFTNTDVFRLMCDAGGGSHTERYKLNSNSYPVDYTEFEMTATVDGTTIETVVVGMRAWISVDVTADVSPTVTPSALTLSTTQPTPTVFASMIVTPSVLSLSLELKDPVIINFHAQISEGPGGIGTRFVSSKYPAVDGIIGATTTQKGHREFIEVEEDLTIPRENTGLH